MFFGLLAPSLAAGTVYFAKMSSFQTDAATLPVSVSSSFLRQEK